MTREGRLLRRSLGAPAVSTSRDRVARQRLDDCCSRPAPPRVRAIRRLSSTYRPDGQGAAASGSRLSPAATGRGRRWPTGSGRVATRRRRVSTRRRRRRRREPDVDGASPPVRLDRNQLGGRTAVQDHRYDEAVLDTADELASSPAQLAYPGDHQSPQSRSRGGHCKSSAAGHGDVRYSVQYHAARSTAPRTPSDRWREVNPPHFTGPHKPFSASPAAVALASAKS